MTPAKVLLLGLLGLVIGQVILWWQDSASPLLGAALAVAAGAIPLVIDFVKASRPAPRPVPRPGYPETMGDGRDPAGSRSASSSGWSCCC